MDGQLYAPADLPPGVRDTALEKESEYVPEGDLIRRREGSKQAAQSVASHFNDWGIPTSPCFKLIYFN
jgi:hypothetical protein